MATGQLSRFVWKAMILGVWVGLGLGFAVVLVQLHR